VRRLFSEDDKLISRQQTHILTNNNTKTQEEGGTLDLSIFLPSKSSLKASVPKQKELRKRAAALQ
jgi:hypothetical protein